MGFSSYKSYGIKVGIPNILLVVPPPPAYIVRPQPLIWLKFDSGDITNTTTLKNYGTQGGDATLQKAGSGSYPTITTGQKIGSGCISLVGNTRIDGGYISCAPITTSANGLTFSQWFKFDPAQGSPGSPNYSRLFDFASGQLLAFVSYGDIVTYTPQSSLYENYGPTFISNEWFHYAWTMTPDGVWHVYINGTYIATTNGGLPTPGTITGNVIGKSNYGDPYITALFDDFRFWHYIIIFCLILALYNNTYDTTPSS